jgi:3-deoxy-D-manno-octulosonic-acid transferase
MHVYDIVYFAGLGLSCPVWLALPKPRRKVLDALRHRLNPTLASPSQTPSVLVHAVSLGEVNATRTLVTEVLGRRADLRVIVTASSKVGYARVQELYGPNPRVTVERFPLDFSAPITRLLDHHRPSAVVLMELELWPNFLRLCAKRSIPVALVNGRLTKHSLRRYRLIAPIARRMFRSLALLCVQDDTYRERFISVGADPAKVHVTGTMKFDTAQLALDPDQAAALARDLGLTAAAPLLVAGSTGPGEEQAILDAYIHLKQSHPTLRLALIPRQPNRFDEVAHLIQSRGLPLARRSQGPVQTTAPTDAILLGDTLGELRNFYALADVIFVGRSLVDLGPKQHGSDMIEAAALGKPVIVGPFTGNFADAMRLLRRNDAIIEVETPTRLEREINHLLTDAARAAGLADRARRTVTEGQGATRRHADRILTDLLKSPAVP